MIVCGWCSSATAPGLCSTCGRDPALPWLQRGSEPPDVKEQPAGRPRLDPAQIKHRLRLALKELPEATNAELAEHLGIGETTVRNWRKVAGL